MKLDYTFTPLTAAERMRRTRDARKPNRGPGPRLTDELDVQCWCRTHVDRIPAEVVRAGNTWSCGPDCRPPKETR